jgi:type VI secretion system protein VasG
VNELRTLQSAQPIVPLQVDGHVVAEIVASWTGIPLGRMVKDELQTVLNLKALLTTRVIGQTHAIKAIAQRVRTARANLEDPNKPKGVFLFVGPSGVGKTETALALADVLYGGERKLVTINMSEYQEAHSVSRTQGLAARLRRVWRGRRADRGRASQSVQRRAAGRGREGAPDVLELFYQVFDKGVLDDAEGREIDFPQLRDHPDIERRVCCGDGCLPQQARRRTAECRRAGRDVAAPAIQGVQTGFSRAHEGRSVLSDP